MMQDKIEEAINQAIDLPHLNEQEEGYLIHLVVALVVTLIYLIVKMYGSP